MVKRGIVLTGGGEMVRKLDVVLSEKLNVKVVLTDDAQRCVSKGTIKFFENPSRYKYTYGRR